MRLAPVLLVVVLAACSSKDTQLGTFNTPPNVTITSPVDGQSFDEGTSITFTGSVGDDAGPETVALSWASDIDGVLLDEDAADPEGNVDFTTANLSPGNHVITLTAVDSDAERAESLIHVGIIDLPEAPEIEIIHPGTGDHAIEGDSFELVATVSDAQDAPEDLAVHVISDVAGDVCDLVVDATGVGKCTVTMAAGDQLFTFTVTDLDGETADATSYFAVTPLTEIDNDGDGFTETQGDCDDTNSAIKPGAVEVANGVDDNCNATVDEGTENYDDDGDGYSEVGGDCNDATSAIGPAATESCNGTDDNCNGSVDEPGATGCQTFFGDWDGDGYGNDGTTDCECAASVSYPATRGGDCYDYNGFANPVSTAYYTTQRGDGSYDYNCDGSETRQSTAVAGQCSFFGSFCSASYGWKNSVPSCGATGTILDSCSLDFFSCGENTHSAVQACK
jgi:hypothetical protein